MDSNLTNHIYGNAFNLIPQLGPVSLTRLLNYFGSFETAWVSPASEYKKAGLSEKLITYIVEAKPRTNPEKAFAELTSKQIQIISITDPEYPELLKEIHTAPPLLYIRGNKGVLKKSGIGVVGTRKISPYGKLCCEELITGLIQNNLSVVSGLAFGIDAQALNLCIDQGGMPIAVLASDLDDRSISPRSNFDLSQKIIQTGCLVSEHALGSQSFKQNFPVRNRIISGLSIGTLVVEADIDSGSLITANYAVEQNREVFAVPGPIFAPGSRGTNQLLKKGAKLVTSTADILDELNLSPATIPDTIQASTDEEEKSILNTLTRDGIHIDELIKNLAGTAKDINSKLTILEMKNRVKNLGGGYFARLH